MSKSILQQGCSCSDYFEFSHPTKDIAAEFGYDYALAKQAGKRALGNPQKVVI